MGQITFILDIIAYYTTTPKQSDLLHFPVFSDSDVMLIIIYICEHSKIQLCEYKTYLQIVILFCGWVGGCEGFGKVTVTNNNKHPYGEVLLSCHRVITSDGIQ